MLMTIFTIWFVGFAVWVIWFWPNMRGHYQVALRQRRYWGSACPHLMARLDSWGPAIFWPVVSVVWLLLAVGILRGPVR